LLIEILLIEILLIEILLIEILLIEILLIEILLIVMLPIGMLRGMLLTPATMLPQVTPMRVRTWCKAPTRRARKMRYEVPRMRDWLKHRAEERELMDDFSKGGEELKEALRHLRRLNRIFGAAGPTLYGVRRLWAEAGKPRRLAILDIGSGSGEINRHLLRWADASGVELDIVLTDITEEACGEAALVFRGEPRVRVERGDLFGLPEACADVVTATQFAHHFSTGELPRVVRTMLGASRIGIVINDIHRHWIPWTAAWLVTRLVSRNRYIRHDGPLSVAKGFRANEWRSLLEAVGSADVQDWSVVWRPMFRHVVIAKKERLHDGADA